MVASCSSDEDEATPNTKGPTAKASRKSRRGTSEPEHQPVSQLDLSAPEIDCEEYDDDDSGTEADDNCQTGREQE